MSRPDEPTNLHPLPDPRHAGYVVEHLEDMPEVRDWVWTDA